MFPQPQPLDPAAPSEPSYEELAAQVAHLTELVNRDPAAPTDDTAAVSSPASTVSSVTEPASSVLPPAPGTLVHQRHVPPGAETEVDRYGIVVSVDAEQNTAAVSWFLAEPTSVRGDAITQVA